MDVKITERGWAGHLMCSDMCKFRRNTLIEYGDKKWIVSTVGCFVCENQVETIGFERFYETMAFEAKEYSGYWDADISKQIPFNSNWAICAESWEQLITSCPNVDNDANNMHDTVVKELSEKIKHEQGKWLDYSDEGYVECPFCYSATNCEDNIDDLKYCFSCGARLESDAE